MRKRTIALALALVLVICAIGGAWAATGTVNIPAYYAGITVSLDGEIMALKDVNGKTVEPFIVDGTTYIPVRGVFESLGYYVTWDAKNNQVVILSELPQSIGLTGVNNARELGGYTTKDGRTVNSGLLLRTARLNELTESDIAILTETYKLRDIVDFRYASELAQHPTPKIKGVTNSNLSVLEDPYASVSSSDEAGTAELQASKYNNYYLNVLAMMGMGSLSSAEVKARTYGYMQSTYVTCVTSELALEAYRQFFEILLEDETGAVLWHCTSGKDRTGVAAALLLSALGCSRETIIEDYLLTNAYFAKEVEEQVASARAEVDDENILESVRMLIGVDQGYIETMFKTIDNTYGSMDAFLRDALKLSDSDIIRLREKYTH